MRMWIPGLLQVEVPEPTAPPELATTLGQILGWARYGTLWAGGLAVLLSALVWGVAANSSNYQNVSRAKAGILTGLIVFFIGLSINTILSIVPEI